MTAQIADASGSISATWFNQPWIADRLKPGTPVRLRGRLGRYGFDVKSYDVGEARATADFAPVYGASEAVPSWRLRELARAALAEHARDVLDPLPAELELPLRRDALARAALPGDAEEAEEARRRLALDELLALQLAVLRSRDEDAVAAPLGAPGELVARYRAALPFALTEHQERAIARDRRATSRARCRCSGCSRATSAPARRSSRSTRCCARSRRAAGRAHGADGDPRRAALPHGRDALRRARRARRAAHRRRRGRSARAPAIASGEAQIAVGTHALIQRDVEFADLAVAVVDEQHRFGVEQRQALAERRSPHVLHMTATPIPRTLALTVYGDLAVSEIAKPPANRQPIVTAWVGAERSSEAYERLRAHLDAGRQAYVVCPLIEASETRSRARPRRRPSASGAPSSRATASA